MSFPFIFAVAGIKAPAHLVFDWAAWAFGFNLYRLRRSRNLLSTAHAGIVVFAAAAGGFCGARILGALAGAGDGGLLAAFARGDRTIVGALIGGIAGVELAKRCLHVTTRTGDEVVLPLAFGLAIGRIGCFLSGLTDRTHGLPTSLPWGVDGGDGVLRHPVQLYESFFVLLLLGAIQWRQRLRPFIQGDLFRAFIVGYFLFRFAVDFLKPFPVASFGITAIQIAALLGAAVYGKAAWRLAT